jgi:hypothetical protein
MNSLALHQVSKVTVLERFLPADASGPALTIVELVITTGETNFEVTMYASQPLQFSTKEKPNET